MKHDHVTFIDGVITIILLAVDEVGLAHQSLADAVGQVHGEGEDQSILDVITADSISSGGDRDEGHEGECGRAPVVSPEVDLQAELQVSKFSAGGHAVVGRDIGFEDELEIHVGQKTDLEIGRGKPSGGARRSFRPQPSSQAARGKRVDVGSEDSRRYEWCRHWNTPGENQSTVDEQDCRG